jgi:RecJ-like exonuclease
MENNFRKRNFRPRTRPLPKRGKLVEGIVNLKDGDYYSGNVKIMKKAQPGPVIFSISDGYGTIEAVIKNSDFETGETVKISGAANQRAGKLQIEIEEIKKSDFNLDQVIEKNSEPRNKSFSIESEKLEKLRPYFQKIAKRIRKAVIENQSILIRHHSDSDGINAGIAIEHSCRMLMEKMGVNADYNLYRSPSRAPFYDISDVFRDAVLIKRTVEKHGQIKPLVIVLDNGSTPEDVFGVKTLKSLGFEIIVIDHHNPVVLENKKTLVDPYVSLHLNPYIEGLNGRICAGMLAYEMGRWICEDYSNPALPAVAGISDRAANEETDKYIKNSQRTKEELGEIGTAIDFIAYHLKFNSGEGLFEELYKNQELVRNINKEVRKSSKTQLESTLPYLRTLNLNGILFSTIDLEKYTMKFKFPNPGRVVSMIHDTVAEGKENLPAITLGYLPDMIILRASKPVLPLSNIIKKLKHDLPYSHLEGGGHECAGTFKFTPAHLTDVLENVKKQVEGLNYLEKSQEE